MRYVTNCLNNFGDGNYRHTNAWNCFLPGKLRWTILPKARCGVTLSIGELDTQPSTWETNLYHWAIATPTKSLSPMPRCQVMLWCAVGELLRNQR